MIKEKLYQIVQEQIDCDLEPLDATQSPAVLPKKPVQPPASKPQQSSQPVFSNPQAEKSIFSKLPLINQT